MIYYGSVESFLRKCADRTHFDGGTRMVLRTIVLDQIKCFYHILSFILNNGIVTKIIYLRKHIKR